MIFVLWFLVNLLNEICLKFSTNNLKILCPLFKAGYGYDLFNRQTIVHFRQGMVYLTDKPLRISGRVWVRFI